MPLPADGDLRLPHERGQHRNIETEYAALYAQVPEIDCQMRCARHCGPIVVPETEWKRMERATGRGADADETTCVHLDVGSGRCRAHPMRPLVCRLWGVVEDAPCPYGCVPERWLTRAEADRLLEQALMHSGGRVLASWRGWRTMIDRAPDAPSPER